MSAIDPHAERVNYGPLRFLYRLNPLAKILAPAPVMIFLIFTRDVFTPLAVLALAVVVVLIGAHLAPRILVMVLVGAPIAVGLLSVSFGLWTDPSQVDTSVVLFQVGGYRFYLGAWLAGLSTALRLTSLLCLSLISGLTTTGPDLVRSTVQQLHLPYRIGYTALAAFRFVPRFGFELDVIRSAHRVRGMAGGRGPVAGVRRWLGYVVPLLAGAIRHAERVALAMDARAFGASPGRTERHQVPFRVRDWVFVLAFWAACIALVLAAPGTRLAWQ